MSDNYKEPPVPAMPDSPMPALPGVEPGSRAIGMSVRTAEDGRVGVYLSLFAWTRVCSVLVMQTMDDDVRGLGEQLAADLEFERIDP